MALKMDPSLQAELISWCKEAGIDESHALMLINVPVHTDIAAIEEVMEAVTRRTSLTFSSGVV